MEQNIFTASTALEATKKAINFDEIIRQAIESINKASGAGELYCIITTVHPPDVDALISHELKRRGFDVSWRDGVMCVSWGIQI